MQPNFFRITFLLLINTSNLFVWYNVFFLKVGITDSDVAELTHINERSES